MSETAWDAVQRLCAEAGMEITWDHHMVEHPDLVCEPMVDDPWSDSGAQVCAIHQAEWWPCRAFREGRGVQSQPATLEPMFMTRPRDK